jgi:hypothetical protein
MSIANSTVYLNIASLLPHNTVRDVKIYWIKDPLLDVKGSTKGSTCSFYSSLSKKSAGSKISLEYELQKIRRKFFSLGVRNKMVSTKQSKALQLADALEKYWGAESGHDRERQAAAELRRLHVVNKELLEALQLALSSHGVMLLSDPPQDAWKVRGVEAKARAAIAKASDGEKE